MGNLRRIRRQSGKLRQSQTSPAGSVPSGMAQHNGHPERIELDRSELEAILERAKTTALSQEEYTKLHAAMETLIFLTEELEKNRVSVQRLKQLLFGATTEKTQKVMEKILDEAGKASKLSDDIDDDGKEAQNRQKAKGHGRNGAEKYIGAETVRVQHESLKPGDSCPNCKKGTVYQSVEPSRLVRVTGQAPLKATVYELQKLRCNLCGEIFTAQAPPGVGDDKYDAESASMIALLKYGSGLPFNRLERLQSSLGIPLPAATQWEIVEHSADSIEPVFEEIIRQAAQGQVLHNDDTTMKVLELMTKVPENHIESEGIETPDRTGVFTSGIVSVLNGRRIALFFTGRRHAGENLAAVLKQRASELGSPIQMCDALSRNMPDELETILANCLSHGRRHFVDVAMNFPQECLHVLNILKKVYKNDAEAKRQGLSPEQRLKFHQTESSPKMDELNSWLTEQIDQRKVEPNSSLGEAINYMLKHWNELTLFLRQAGAPLDNNICEQALKKAILHRKNSYFYLTQNGARVGDLFMSLIHTCELNGVNPFDYLTQLQKHIEAAALCPADWMPWNYQEMLQRTDVTHPQTHQTS
jgi:transposase